MQHKKKGLGGTHNGCELGVQRGARSNEHGLGDDVVSNGDGEGGFQESNGSGDEMGTLVETPPASPPPYDQLYQQRLITTLLRENNALTLENHRLQEQNDEANVLLEDLMTHYRAEVAYSRNKTETLTAILNVLSNVRNRWDRQAEIANNDVETVAKAVDGVVAGWLVDLPDLAVPQDNETEFEGDVGAEAETAFAHVEDYANSGGLGSDTGERLVYDDGEGPRYSNGEGQDDNTGNNMASDHATYEHAIENATEDPCSWLDSGMPRTPFQYYDEGDYALLRLEFDPGNNVPYSW